MNDDRTLLEPPVGATGRRFTYGSDLPRTVGDFVYPRWRTGRWARRRAPITH